jgi:hypothetical protein
MTIAQLTHEQAEQLQGVEFVKDNFFNPILDADGNYIISLEEVKQCDIEWVKELPRIEYKSIINELI